MIPRVQFRISMPLFIAFLGGAVIAITAHYRWPNPQRTIEFGAALLGGGTALYTLLLNVQVGRASAANSFVRRWNDPDFESYRKELAKAVDTNGTDGLDMTQIRACLNFFEETAISVNRREAEEAALKDFFFTVVLTLYRATKPWIEKRRDAKNQPTGYINFEELYKRWEPRKVR
jgi:hypothetical protein